MSINNLYFIIVLQVQYVKYSIFRRYLFYLSYLFKILVRVFTCVSVLSETECVLEVMSKTKMSGNLDRIMLL